MSILLVSVQCGKSIWMISVIVQLGVGDTEDLPLRILDMNAGGHYDHSSSSFGANVNRASYA